MSVLCSQGARLGAALLLCALAASRTASAQGNSASIVWGSYIGGTGLERVTGMAQVGSSGADDDVAVVGYTFSTDLSPDAGTGTVNPSDAFLARFMKTGETRHSHLRFGGADTDEAHAAVFGSGGNVYIVGKTRSAVFTPAVTVYGTAGTTEDNPNDDAFLARVDATGVLKWVMYLGGNRQDVATGVTILNDTLYIVGRTTSALFLGQPELSPSADGFVARVRLDVDLVPSVEWVKRIGSPRTDEFTGVTLDEEGYVLAVGSSEDQLAQAGLEEVSPFHGPEGTPDAVVVKLNPGTGAPLWATYVGTTVREVGRAIVRDPLVSGQVAVVGNTDSASFDQGPGLPGQNVFVVRLDSQGRQTQARVIGGDRDDEALAAAVDNAGNVYVGGRTGSSDLAGSNSFDENIESSLDNSLREGFVYVVPPEGPGWKSYVGGANHDEVGALSIRVGRRLILAGQTYSDDRLGGLFSTPSHDATLSGGGPDGFVVDALVRDITPPSLGQVADGPRGGPDLETQSSRDSVAARWVGGTDSESTLVAYEWAIGVQGDPESARIFHSLPFGQTDAEVLNLDPPLEVGTTYYVTVRARNDMGLTRSARSTGVTVALPDGGLPPPQDGGTDGGTGGPDGGTDGPDAGDGGPDGGDTPGDPKDTGATLGFGCASGGGAAVPLLLGLLVLALAARRLSASAR